MLDFKTETGTLEFADSGLPNAVLNFKFSHFDINSTELSWHVDGDGFAGSCDRAGICFKLQISSGCTLIIAVENNSETELFLEQIKLAFPPSLDSSDYLEYLHSRSFDKICGTRKVGMANRWFQGEISSSMVYCLSGYYEDKAMLIGALPPHSGDYVTIKALHEESHLEGRFGIEITSEQARLIPVDGTAATSPLSFALGNDATALLEAYGDAWAEKRTRELKPRCQGWNSWDYYAGAVTAEDCFENMVEGRKNFGDAFKYVVIDEGWEPRWGAWVPNWKFPDGIEDFVQRVEADDCVPGIWTAALLVNTYTDTYREHPEWFGHDKAGNIVTKLYSYGPMAFLDPTHPGAAEFLRDIFVRLRQAGMKYFKVDFTQETLLCDCFHDMTAGRGGVIRRGFEIIREAIGDDAYLLSCGAPFESVTGLVDCVRTTADVHNFWGHVLANGGVMASRWWMSGKLFNVDPDFLIVRTPDTSLEPMLNRKHTPVPFDGKNWWMAGRDFNLQEAKVYALSIYLNAGDIFLGDAIGKLNETGIDLLKRIFTAPTITKSAVPLDLFDSHSEQASVLIADEEWGTAVCVTNWNDDIESVSIEPDTLDIEFSRACDFWTLEDEGKLESYDIELMPRSAKCILFMK
jgi:hypothetical protein